MWRLHKLLAFCFILVTFTTHQSRLATGQVTRSAGNNDQVRQQAVNNQHEVANTDDESHQEIVHPSISVRTPPPVKSKREQAARVGEPAVLNALSAMEGESVLMRSNIHTRRPTSSTDERCQYTFSVPTGPQCSSALIEAKVAELYHAFSGFEAKLEGQQNRLEAAETFIRRANRALNTEGLFFPSSDSSSDGDSITSRGFLQPDIAEEEEELGAADALLDFAHQLNSQLLRLQSRVKGIEAERSKLFTQNQNLTEFLHNTTVKLDELGVENRQLMEQVERGTSDLTLALHDNDGLREIHRMLASDKQSLSDAKDLLSQRVRFLSEENRGIRSTIQTQRDEIERLLTDKDTWESRHSNATKKIRELEQALAELRQNNGSASPSAPPCEDRVEEEVEDNQDYSQCGRLVALSEPETVGESATSLGRYGVWMRDPLAHPQNENIWVVNVIFVRVTKLLKFANLRKFRDRKPASMHRLQFPLESTGAVTYNGSLYYQRRNSRKIVRFDLTTLRTVRQRQVKNAGYHGMFAYQYGGYSDIDLAVDETGIWVIYSTRANKGNIVVSKLDPNTLKIIKTIRTKISKLSVANAFISCQTLYTISAYNTANAKINFAVDLRTRKVTRPNIPFVNSYRHTVMIDYNPRDRYLYAWDNGRQVRYKATLDETIGPISEMNTFRARTTRTTRP